MVFYSWWIIIAIVGRGAANKKVSFSKSCFNGTDDDKNMFQICRHTKPGMGNTVICLVLTKHVVLRYFKEVG